jgi:predicted metalloprotease
VTKIRSTDSSRIQDRRGQGGGGGFSFPGLGGGGGMGIPTKMGGGIIGIIVVLAALFLPKLLGGASQPAVNSTGETSGDAEEICDDELEQILCGGTEDVQNYWATAYPQAFGGEYDDTETVFFTGATGTNCGQASAEVGPFYCPADRFVYFDLDFLTQLQQQFGATGDLAAQYIVGHEYGHHVQNLLGISDQVRQAQAAQPGQANAYSVALELQADCFAGAWARSAEDRGLLEPGEIEEALNAAAAVGDDRIQQQTTGRIDRESWTHGSSEQRVQWFRRGFDTGDPQQCNTFEEL